MLTVFYNGFNVIQIVDPINSMGVRLRKCYCLSQLAANTGNTRQNRSAGYSYTASSYHQTPCPALPCPPFVPKGTCCWRMFHRVVVHNMQQNVKSQLGTKKVYKKRFFHTPLLRPTIAATLSCFNYDPHPSLRPDLFNSIPFEKRRDRCIDSH